MTECNLIASCITNAKPLPDQKSRVVSTLWTMAGMAARNQFPSVRPSIVQLYSRMGSSPDDDDGSLCRACQVEKKSNVKPTTLVEVVVRSAASPSLSLSAECFVWFWDQTRRPLCGGVGDPSQRVCAKAAWQQMKCGAQLNHGAAVSFATNSITWNHFSSGSLRARGQWTVDAFGSLSSEIVEKT